MPGEETNSAEAQVESTSPWAEVMGSDEKVVEGSTAEGTAQDETRAGTDDNKTDDNRENSRLGRKVADLERQLAENQASTSRLISSLQSMVNRPQEEELPEFLTTPADFEKYGAIKQRRAQQAQQQYEITYRRAFDGFRKENPDLHDDIFQEMFANHNHARTGNPIVDAEINYLKAERALLKKGSLGGGSLRQERAKGTGVSAVASPGKSGGSPKLDPGLSKLLDGLDLSNDEINTALNEWDKGARRR